MRASLVAQSRLREAFKRRLVALASISILLSCSYFACVCLSERVFVCVLGYSARIYIACRDAFVLSIPMKIALFGAKIAYFFASGGAPQAGEARV